MARWRKSLPVKCALKDSGFTITVVEKQVTNTLQLKHDRLKKGEVVSPII